MNTRARSYEILRRHNAGEKHKDIGKAFGITGERVRQIVRRAGGAPRHKNRSGQFAKVALFLKENPMTITEAANALSLPKSTIRSAAQKFGLIVPKITAAREAELAPLAQRVLAGESYYSASGKDHALQSRLAMYCRAKGIKSRHPYRRGGLEVDTSRVELKETARDTALANRGRATAGQIAAAIGTTRNAVIGHWFRARQLGLIQ